MVSAKPFLRSSVLLAALAALAPQPARADVANDPWNLDSLGAGSIARGISDDGSVVGESSVGSSGAYHAVRWTQGVGVQDLGTLGTGTVSYGLGISGDEGVVVGDSFLTGSSGARHAFRWTESGGMQDLGTLGTGTVSRAYGVSANGSTIVGYSYLAGSSGAQHAFRWTESGGMQDLGTLGTGTGSQALGVSGDGSTIVGWSYLAGSSGAWHAFR